MSLMVNIGKDSIMKLSEVKKCEWCEKEFTGRRTLSRGCNWDGAACWCSSECFDEMCEHSDEMEQLMSENAGLQRALLYG